jgi:hypothetical protein
VNTTGHEARLEQLLLEFLPAIMSVGRQLRHGHMLRACLSGDLEALLALAAEVGAAAGGPTRNWQPVRPGRRGCAA